MALRTKTRERLYQMHTYRAGRIEAAALRGFFHVVEKVQGHNVLVPDLQVSQFPAQTSTDSDVDAAGAGRLYFIWAASPTTADIDTFVEVEDNNIIIFRGKVTPTRALEVYFYDDVDGVGIPYSTDLEVRAVLAAGGNPDAADRPDIVVVWGDNAINTEDRNLINVNYG